MKKIIISLLAFIYLGLSSGIAMEIHYCMGKKSSVAFYSDDQEKCSKCGMTDKLSGCCHDKHQFFKISDAHQTVANQLNLSHCEIALPVSYIYYNGPSAIITAANIIQVHSPPNYTRPSICILNCIFRL